MVVELSVGDVAGVMLVWQRYGMASERVWVWHGRAEEGAPLRGLPFLILTDCHTAVTAQKTGGLMDRALFTCSAIWCVRSVCTRVSATNCGSSTAALKGMRDACIPAIRVYQRLGRMDDEFAQVLSKIDMATGSSMSLPL